MWGHVGEGVWGEDGIHKLSKATSQNINTCLFARQFASRDLKTGDP